MMTQLARIRFLPNRGWQLFAFGAFCFLLLLPLASWLALGSPFIWETFARPSIGGLMLLCTAAGLASWWLTWRWGRFPYADVFGSSVTATLLPFLVVVVILVFSRWWYSRPFLLITFFGCLVLNFAILYWRSRTPFRVGLVPSAIMSRFVGLPRLQAQLLEQPLDNLKAVAIVADLHHPHDPMWTRFLAQSVARGIPILDAATILEEVTGRVWLERLAHDSTGLLISRLYLGFKRFWETLFLIVISPLWLPVVLMVGLWVRLDSAGPVLFYQNRVGLGGRVFKMVKFRSMRPDSEVDGAQFAAASDDRITRVGKIIRKFRLDELPQILNILKGDMAFIGPRPEQSKFAEEFSNTISFYDARHLVRPGLTGWAQVVHGYTASEDETRVKLEYDLYYVKHFSFWLDLLIILKTIKVVLTGFGSR